MSEEANLGVGIKFVKTEEIVLQAISWSGHNAKENFEF